MATSSDTPCIAALPTRWTIPIRRVDDVMGTDMPQGDKLPQICNSLVILAVQALRLFWPCPAPHRPLDDLCARREISNCGEGGRGPCGACVAKDMGSLQPEGFSDGKAKDCQHVHELGKGIMRLGKEWRGVRQGSVSKSACRLSPFSDHHAGDPGSSDLGQCKSHLMTLKSTRCRVS